jgi:hypothetical protein
MQGSVDAAYLLCMLCCLNIQHDAAACSQLQPHPGAVTHSIAQHHLVSCEVNIYIPSYAIDSPCVMAGEAHSRDRLSLLSTPFVGMFASQYIAPPSPTLAQTSRQHPPSCASPTDAFYKKIQGREPCAQVTERAGACMLCMAPANGGVIATHCSAASAVTRQW